MTTAFETILTKAREQGIADAEAERMAAKKPTPSAGATAINKAAGDTASPRFVGLDRAKIADAQARFDAGEENALVDCFEIMGTKRFMRAAPRDMKAELQATLKSTGAQMAAKLRDARPKAKKPKARPQAVRTSQARPVAQPAPRGEAEGAKELRALIAQHAPNQTAPDAGPSQAEIARTWQEAHDKVARETGRIR